MGEGIPADLLKAMAMKGAAFSHGGVAIFKIIFKKGFLARCFISRSLHLFSPQDFPIKWDPGPIEISRSYPGDFNKPRIFIWGVQFVWLFSKHSIKLPKKGKLILKSHCNLIIWNTGRNLSIKSYRTPAHQILYDYPQAFLLVRLIFGHESVSRTVNLHEVLCRFLQSVYGIHSI